MLRGVFEQHVKGLRDARADTDEQRGPVGQAQQPVGAGELGNWSEPLGLAALFVEGTVIATAGYALSALSPVRLLRRQTRRPLATAR